MKRAFLFPLAIALGWTGALSVLSTVQVAHADPDSRAGVVAERPRDAGVHAVDGEVRTVAQVGSSVVIGGSFTKVGPVTRGAVGVVDTVDETFGARLPRRRRLGQRWPSPTGPAAGTSAARSRASAAQPRTNLAQVDAAGRGHRLRPRAQRRGARPGPHAPAGDLFVGGSFTDHRRPDRATVSPRLGARRWPRLGRQRHRRLGASPRPVRRRSPASTSAATSPRSAAPVYRRLAGPRRRHRRPQHHVRQRHAQPAGQRHRRARQRRGAGRRLASPRSAAPPGCGWPTSTAPRVRSARVNVSINNTVNDLELDDAGNVVYVGGTFGTVGGVDPQPAGRRRAWPAPARSPRWPSPASPATSSARDPRRRRRSLPRRLLPDHPGEGQPGGDRPGRDRHERRHHGRALLRDARARWPGRRSSGTSGALTLVAPGRLAARRRRLLRLRHDRAQPAWRRTTSRPAPCAPTSNPAPNGQVNIVKASANGAGGLRRRRVHHHRRRDAAPRSPSSTSPPAQNVPGFAASANSYVKDMAVRTDGTTVYVGGNFDIFNGVADQPARRDRRRHRARHAPASTMPLTEPTNDMSEGGLRAMALSPDETRLMVIGNFRKIAGARPAADRPDRRLRPDRHGDRLAHRPLRPALRPQRQGRLHARRRHRPGRSAGVRRQRRPLLLPGLRHRSTRSRWRPAAPTCQPLWSDKIGDTIEAVAADQDAVYISGHFRYLETETKTEPRFQIAAARPGHRRRAELGPQRRRLPRRADPRAGAGRPVRRQRRRRLRRGQPRPQRVLADTRRPGIEVRKAPSRPWVLGAVRRRSPTRSGCTTPSPTGSVTRDRPERRPAWATSTARARARCRRRSAPVRCTAARPPPRRSAAPRPPTSPPR